MRSPISMIRWPVSILRMAIGGRTMVRTGQVGDGREQVLLEHVRAHATAGDPDSVVDTIDDFARHHSVLMNVGDRKGLLLDAAIQRAAPALLLELGAYCGYSAVRTARLLPDRARLVSVEANPDNAEIARAVIEYAGLADRASVVVGMIGDGGATMRHLAIEHDFGPAALDFVFLDHLKTAYLPDLRSIMAAGWLHPGTVVVADNVKVPGAPDYRRYTREEEGRAWRTIEHKTYVEYQSLISDLVLESEYLG
ncbi:O-methyltransferase [Nocardia altamirensis]|uniref:O-methyltransferase n=1 Tax=Nocardia altamirensis TaxID=472158 RepID=UPI0008405D28|nr:class I SAM-dependent methyltransferase [Nocardia altamirensis]